MTPECDLFSLISEQLSQGDTPAACPNNSDGFQHYDEKIPKPEGEIKFVENRQTGSSGTPLVDEGLLSSSSSFSARRAKDTTRSPSSISISRTPCVLRPMIRISLIRRRMILPLLVTSIS